MHTPESAIFLIVLIHSCLARPNTKSEILTLGGATHKDQVVHARAHAGLVSRRDAYAPTIIPSLTVPRCKTECDRIWRSPLWPRPERATACYNILCRGSADPDQRDVQDEENAFAGEAARRCFTLGPAAAKSCQLFGACLNTTVKVSYRKLAYSSV